MTRAPYDPDELRKRVRARHSNARRFVLGHRDVATVERIRGPLPEGRDVLAFTPTELVAFVETLRRRPMTRERALAVEICGHFGVAAPRVSR